MNNFINILIYKMSVYNHNRIISLKAYIEQNENTINRLSELKDDFSIHLVEKSKNRIIELEEELKLREEGLWVDEERVIVPKKVVNKKLLEDEKQKKLIILNKKFSIEAVEKGEKRRDNNNWNSEYKYHLKQVNKLPEYLKKKLASMPENKGEIWHGIYFYGLLPREHWAVYDTIFEKRGSSLFIHEIDFKQREHRTFEKKGQERKVLVLRKPLKNLKFSNHCY